MNKTPLNNQSIQDAIGSLAKGERMKPNESNTLAMLNIDPGGGFTALSYCPAEIQTVLAFFASQQTPVVLVFNITNNNNINLGNTQASNITVATADNITAMSGHNNDVESRENSCKSIKPQPAHNFLEAHRERLNENQKKIEALEKLLV